MIMVQVMNSSNLEEYLTLERPKSLNTQEFMDTLNPLPLFDPPLMLAVFGKHIEPSQPTPTVNDPPPLGGTR